MISPFQSLMVFPTSRHSQNISNILIFLSYHYKKWSVVLYPETVHSPSHPLGYCQWDICHSYPPWYSHFVMRKSHHFPLQGFKKPVSPPRNSIKYIQIRDLNLIFLGEMMSNHPIIRTTTTKTWEKPGFSADFLPEKPGILQGTMACSPSARAMRKTTLSEVPARAAMPTFWNRR